jgi:transmembrane sensor
MTTPEEVTKGLSPLQCEAIEWVVRLTSGIATAEDANALHEWRARSPEHARALVEAAGLRQKLREVAREPSEGHRVVVPLAKPQLRAGRRAMSRRALLGGALAASTAGLLVRPPLGLWPTLAELTADYRTGTGEQRQIALSDGISLQLNTQTSVAMRPSVGEQRVELISGEAAVSADVPQSKRFVMVAGNGRADAAQANFTVRRSDSGVCVTCIDGEVHVEQSGRLVSLRARQQVTYTEDTLGSVIAVDPDVATAWRKGLLVFHDVPLNLVVDEINRYRPGRIILVGTKLGARLVNGVFQVDRIGGVVDQLRDLGLAATDLPGGVVLVS